MSSIALRYRVPLQALRRANNLYADHLLAARRTIVVPGEYYKGGVSLSPTPLEGEEEELRKAKIRRWMVACKVAEYVFSIPIYSPPLKTLSSGGGGSDGSGFRNMQTLDSVG